MSGRRNRPPGARPPSEKDLKTPKIGQVFYQHPFAPIFQQRMGGGASQGAGSHHDHVDLTGGSGESCSLRMIGTMDPNDWDDEECKTAGDLTRPVTNLCSSDSDVSHEDLPATDTKD